MNDHVMSDDQAFHGDKKLIAELAALNEQLGRYLLRYLDADAGRAEPVSVVDERAFARTLSAMADRLRERANRHTASDAAVREVEIDERASLGGCQGGALRAGDRPCDR